MLVIPDILILNKTFEKKFLIKIILLKAHAFVKGTCIMQDIALQVFRQLLELCLF